MIVSMGNIGWDGTINQGYNVASCSLGAYLGEGNGYCYAITLTGIDYSDTEYVTLVTPVLFATSSPVVSVSTYGLDGNLIVKFAYTSYSYGRTDFSFVVLKMP